ncbi:hypothetical protein ANN_21667 [Periplaneta americana]|uniref:Uncharacterized protein n=1 Tax=Periplaneta americana TaxID=6978 RepID=A0ABQ8S6D4_PERAM|nr:hypothetical protein ANN_21667 [Periplaneta americana]
MSPGSSIESYPAFAHIGLRENPGKNLNQKSNRKSKELAYKTLVRTIMEYGAVGWDPYRKKQIDSIEKVQRKAAKYVKMGKGHEYAIRKVQDNREDFELNGLHQLLVYADDVNMLAENPQTTRENTGILLEATTRDGNDISVFTKYRYFRFDIAIYRYRNFDSIYRIIYRFSHKFIDYFVGLLSLSTTKSTLDNSDNSREMALMKPFSSFFTSEIIAIVISEKPEGSGHRALNVTDVLDMVHNLSRFTTELPSRTRFNAKCPTAWRCEILET